MERVVPTELEFKNKEIQKEINEYLKPKLDYQETFRSGTLKYEKPSGPKEDWDGSMLERSMIGDEQMRLEGRIAKKIREIQSKQRALEAKEAK